MAWVSALAITSPAITKAFPGVGSHRRVCREICFQAHPGCWQKWVPCNCETEASVSLLAISWGGTHFFNVSSPKFSVETTIKFISAGPCRGIVHPVICPPVVPTSFLWKPTWISVVFIHSSARCWPLHRWPVNLSLASFSGPLFTHSPL